MASPPNKTYDWALDSVFDTAVGPSGSAWHNEPNKVLPIAARVSQGYVPSQSLDAESLNYVLNAHGDWIGFVSESVAQLDLTASNHLTRIVELEATGSDHETRITAAETTFDETYQLHAVYRYTANGTWSRSSSITAVKVYVQGAGGGGAGSDSRSSGGSAGQGGGGGGCAVAFITNDDGLTAAHSIVVGAGGAGGVGTAGSPAGTAGGNSSFGTRAIGNGGSGGVAVENQSFTIAPVAADGGGGSLGTVFSGFIVNGGKGVGQAVISGAGLGIGKGGDSFFGAGGNCSPTVSNGTGQPGEEYGGGGGGGISVNGVGTEESDGGDGADGIVIVEEYR